jgi:hypothetical protein
LAWLTMPDSNGIDADPICRIGKIDLLRKAFAPGLGNFKDDNRGEKMKNFL